MLPSLIQLPCQKGYICGRAKSSSSSVIFEHQLIWKKKAKSMFVFTEKSWRRGLFRKYRSSVMESETRCGGGAGSVSRAGRMRALGSNPSGRPKRERCSDTVRGEAWWHLQSTAGVPLSKLPNPPKGTCNPLSRDGHIWDRLSPPTPAPNIETIIIWL